MNITYHKYMADVHGHGDDPEAARDDRPAYTSSDHSEGIQCGHITVRQTEAQFNGVCIDMTLKKTYNRDANTKLFTGISHQPAAMEKNWRALIVLTAVSEQTKAMTHLDLDDTKRDEDINRQAEKQMSPTTR